MGTKQDVGSRAQRLAALGAVALLAAATATTFGRVFVGHATTWRLIAAATISVGLAAAFERRSLLLATIVSGLALVVVVGWFVLPETTWLGAPTRETLGAIADALGRVGREARVQVAPSEPLRPLLLAAVTAVWTASFSAHALAVRAGSPLLAVLPPIALVGFADTVLDDGARPMYALLLLSAVLLIVFADGLRRVRQWGPVWSSPGRRRLSSVAGRGARRVGATALIAALAFPGVLPGFRDDALVDFSTHGPEGVHLDPLVSIRANLVRDQAVPLYRVTARDELGGIFPSYWRAYALDRFDGERWTTTDLAGEHATSLPANSALEPTFAAPETATTTVRQTVQLLREQQDAALPMAYPAADVSVPTTNELRYDAELGTVTVPGALPSATEYAVRSDVVIPTPEDLDELTPASTNAKYTFVPGALLDRVRPIAERWASAASAETAYRRILAIMDRFTSPSSPFEYTTNADTRADADALVDFLTKTHRGFCQQYATAMAVLVRALGYPARVAVGYRTGRADGDAFVVTTHDAHAWVEVRFPTYGWLPFEPTPNRPNPLSHVQGSYLARITSIPTQDLHETGGGDIHTQPAQGAQAPSGCIIDGRRIPGPVCTEPLPRSGRFGGRGIGGTRLTFERPSDAYGIPIRLLLSILVVLAVVLLVLVPVVKWAVRLRIAHRRAPPRETVLAAFRLFDGEAADVGYGRRRGETLTEYTSRLSRSVRFSDGRLARLAGAVTRAAYAPDAVDRDDARTALRDAHVAIRDVRRHVGRVRRVLGVYRPAI